MKAKQSVMAEASMASILRSPMEQTVMSEGES